MTQEQFDALRAGDIVVKKSNGKRYIVSLAYVNVVHGQYVVCRTIRAGKAFGRGYVVKPDTYETSPAPAVVPVIVTSPAIENGPSHVVRVPVADMLNETHRGESLCGASSYGWIVVDGAEVPSCADCRSKAAR